MIPFRPVLVLSIAATAAFQAQAVPTNASAWSTIVNKTSSTIVFRQAPKFKNVGDLYFRKSESGQIVHLGSKTFLYPGEAELSIAPGKSVQVYFDTTGTAFSYSVESGGQMFSISNYTGWSLTVGQSDNGLKYMLDMSGFRNTAGPALITIHDGS